MSTNYDPSRSPSFSNAPVPPKTSGRAVASLICGIASLVVCPVTAIPAVIVGMKSLGDIKKSNGTVTGRGLAITGIVTGVAGLVLMVFFILFCLALWSNRDEFMREFNKAMDQQRQAEMRQQH